MATVQIDNGDAYTDEVIDIGALASDGASRYVLAKLSEAGWTSAKLTIAVSANGTDFYPIAVAGTPIGATPTADVYDTFTIPGWVRTFKFASVNASNGQAVTQGGNRVIEYFVGF